MKRFLSLLSQLYPAVVATLLLTAAILIIFMLNRIPGPEVCDATEVK